MPTDSNGVAAKHDWGLFGIGGLLAICALVFAFAPGITLVMMTALMGAALIATGIFDIVNYVRFRDSLAMSSWSLVYAALDIIVGLMFLLHPIIFAGVIPWLAGAFLVFFGCIEIAGALRARQAAGPMWGWTFASGAVDLLCAVMFFVAPASFVVFCALFLLMRGISLLIFGWKAGDGVD